MKKIVFLTRTAGGSEYRIERLTNTLSVYTDAGVDKFAGDFLTLRDVESLIRRRVYGVVISACKE
jgi:hypothetical protein